MISDKQLKISHTEKVKQDTQENRIKINSWNYREANLAVEKQ